jgi:hypothetical protein
MNFTELVTVLAGISFVFLPFMLKFKSIYKLLYISFGIILIALSFLEKHFIVDIISVFLLIILLSLFRIKGDKLYNN